MNFQRRDNQKGSQATIIGNEHILSPPYTPLYRYYLAAYASHQTILTADPRHARVIQ